MPEDIRWTKSSYSAAQGNCIEVGRLEDAVVVRDSKDPDGPVLSLTRTQWATFIQALKTGAFDAPGGPPQDAGR